VPNVQRLAVFFPALVFGWMRARTGSILAGATFHALCNLFADVLHTSFF
jgi:membrane protease YdiL (CAAX protease family)